MLGALHLLRIPSGGRFERQLELEGQDQLKHAALSWRKASVRASYRQRRTRPRKRDLGIP